MKSLTCIWWYKSTMAKNIVNDITMTNSWNHNDWLTKANHITVTSLWNRNEYDKWNHCE